MVWAGICSKEKLQIAFCSSKMNSVAYQEVLKDNLLPFKRRFRRTPLMLLQDNASIHASRSTSAWLTAYKINVLDFPARSPDLNPIENVWGILVRRIYANNRRFRTLNQLKGAILEAWENLEQSLLNKLVDGMPHRIFEVIQKNGASTHY